MECPYCHQEIKDKAYDLHLKLCPKKPSTFFDKAAKQEVKADDFATEVASEAKIVAAEVRHPMAGAKAIPLVGTPEYMEYWKSLDERGQEAELARRKALEGKPESVVTPPLSATPTTPDTKAKVTTPENGVMEVFYPKPDPYFLVPENIVEALRVTEAISHKHPTNLLITGQPGGGKTSLALQFAAKFGRPIVVVDFGVLQEPQQLFQTTRLIQGDGDTMVTDIRETGFVKGMETEGCICVMDEINRPENERVLNTLMPLLDGRASCWIEDLRRRVNVAKNVIFIATLNEGALFCGITSIDLALRDRFREIFLDYLPAQPESEVLQAKTGVPKIIANSLAEFAYTVRTTPAIGKKISIRQLLHAAEAYSCGTPLWAAISAALGSYNDLQWRQQCLEIMSLNIKDEGEYKKWLNKPKEPRYVKY